LTENEILIKSKKRVQQHGEVFTPKKVVDAMVTLPGLDETIKLATTTVLEPAAGEGVFLTNILARRLELLALQFQDDIIRFENYALLAISTLYGIELLEDNVKRCSINLYLTFHEFYTKFAAEQNSLPKEGVLESAKTMASVNIVQGDFLKRTARDGSPIVFSEWAPLRITKQTKHIRVLRTEYTLDEIYKQVTKKAGSIFVPPIEVKQLALFENRVDEELKPKRNKYVVAKITDVYKQEMEEIDT